MLCIGKRRIYTKIVSSVGESVVLEITSGKYAGNRVILSKERYMKSEKIMVSLDKGSIKFIQERPSIKARKKTTHRGLILIDYSRNPLSLYEINKFNHPIYRMYRRSRLTKKEFSQIFVRVYREFCEKYNLECQL